MVFRMGVYSVRGEEKNMHEENFREQALTIAERDRSERVKSNLRTVGQCRWSSWMSAVTDMNALEQSRQSGSNSIHRDQSANIYSRTTYQAVGFAGSGFLSIIPELFVLHHPFGERRFLFK